MHLQLLVRDYIAARNDELPIGQELAPKTCEHLFECAHVYSKYLERPATTADFDKAVVTEFLKSIIEDGRSAYTAKNRRTGLLVLWRFAHDRGLAPPCTGVRPIACPEIAVDGYDFATMQLFLSHVATLRGVVRNTGIKKSIYWDAFLRVDWEVGLRIGDMLRVEVAHFDRAGWLWFIESKTRKAGWRPLRRSTVESLLACLDASPSRKFIWPGFTRKNVCRAFSELARSAGAGGTSKFIRSGGSSECDREFPGTGWQHCRHSSPAVWSKHYRVDKICDTNRPLPPDLGKVG